MYPRGRCGNMDCQEPISPGVVHYSVHQTVELLSLKETEDYF